jgi:uncharacterized membrane protein
MKAPKSKRSQWLSRTSWAFFAVWLLGNLVVLIFGPLHTITQLDWRFWAFGVAPYGLWLAVLVAYLVSRLNDAWDEEARAQRRAVLGGISERPYPSQ